MGKRVVTAENQAEVAELKARISELETLVKYYDEQFRISKHRQFGASSEKSEYDFTQLSIFNETELFADANVPEPELIEVEKHYRKRARLTTDKLPDDLPVETVEYDLPEAERICPECGGLLHVMGHDTRRELVIKGSFASPEAIAHIMTQKIVMGSPLYRQEQELKQNGIMFSRQTMSNWLIRAAEDWLDARIEAQKSRVRSKVEYVFLIVKRIFGYDKVRYRGLKKNETQAYMLGALVNLFLLAQSGWLLIRRSTGIFGLEKAI